MRPECKTRLKRGSGNVYRDLGLPPSKLLGVLRGKFRGVSERKLIECLAVQYRVAANDAARERAARAWVRGVKKK